MRQRGQKPAPPIDWSTVDYVVGTRADVTRTGIHRPCSRCQEPVFTSRRYPIAVAMICEVCALELVEAEAAAADAAATAEPDPLLDPALDPWRAATGGRPRTVRSSARRRARAKPTEEPRPPTADG